MLNTLIQHIWSVLVEQMHQMEFFALFLDKMLLVSLSLSLCVCVCLCGWEFNLWFGTIKNEKSIYLELDSCVKLFMNPISDKLNTSFLVIPNEKKMSWWSMCMISDYNWFILTSFQPFNLTVISTQASLHYVYAWPNHVLRI